MRHSAASTAINSGLFIKTPSQYQSTMDNGRCQAKSATTPLAGGSHQELTDILGGLGQFWRSLVKFLRRGPRYAILAGETIRGTTCRLHERDCRRNYELRRLRP